MRIQNDLIYDATIDGTTSVYADPSWNDKLGAPDRLTIFAVTDGVSGTTPTLTVNFEESPDQRNWISISGTAQINGPTISTTATTALVGYLVGTFPNSAFVRARIQLGGGTPRARVRLWVTGRGEQAG